MENHKHLVPADKPPGLVCDNPACDYTDPTVKLENLEEHVNMACPKCGENLLTEEDFANVLKVQEIIDLINSIPEEHLDVLAKAMNIEVPEELKDAAPGEQVLLKINTHKEISVKMERIEKTKE